MKHLMIICALVAAAAAASSCEGDGAGPATSPINPFGTEPSTASAVGVEPPTGGSSLAALCARACAHIEAVCPGTGSPNCADDCVTSGPPGCDTQFRAFVQCVATAPLDCASMQIDTLACQTQLNAINSCLSGTSGGTGSGGAAGTAPPR
jgi:hypothetical protein